MFAKIELSIPLDSPNSLLSNDITFKRIRHFHHGQKSHYIAVTFRPSLKGGWLARGARDDGAIPTVLLLF